MAADWIKMDVDLHEKRETLIIARECNVRPEYVVGLLHRIWGWADGQTTDGRVAGASFSDVDLIVCTPGFGDAMHAAGWLQKFRGGISFPHFVRHNGQSAKHRAMNTRRQMSRRKRDKSATNARADETREEKRRVKREGEAPSPARSRTKSAPSRRQTRSIIQWTTDTSFVGITDDDRRKWSAAYPACDLDRQLAAMDVWLRENPAKAHKSRWGRFITSWMSRSQDRGGDEHATTSRITAADDRRAAEAAKQYPEPDDRPLRHY